METLFTSESVTEGHPDKMADQISDAVLDAMVAADPNARVACETLVTTGLVVVTGEISTETYVDISSVVRGVIKDIGYTESRTGFDSRTCAVTIALDEQSSDIAQGVDTAIELREGDGDELDQTGAGDQGMMFGYATTETPELMPLPIMLAHRLTHRLAAVRKDGTVPFLRPDGKAQVTVRYKDGKPVGIGTVVVSTQHCRHWDNRELSLDDDVRPALVEHVIEPICGEWMDDDTTIFVNPTGAFIHGGPAADAGLTGRKIIVDTYGGAARHGGGAFSGKDCTKVDRSAAYAARWVAKNVVAAGLAERCELQLAYAIGVAHPVSINVNTFGTATVSEAAISQAINEVFDLRPAAIINDLDLRRPIYRDTAAYGHFGRTDIDLPWEVTNRIDQLRDAAERFNGAAATVGAGV